MPTVAEAQELCNNCTWTKMTQNGVNGWRVTGLNGNSIFVPAAGCYTGAGEDKGDILDLEGRGAYYWSSIVSDSNCSAENAFYICDDWTSPNSGGFGRILGFSVRPVCP